MQSAYFTTYSHFFALFGNMIQDFRDVEMELVITVKYF